MKPCPFCNETAQIKSWNRDIGSGDFRKLFSAGCFNADCPTQPRAYEWGESGYRQGDTQTNDEARVAVIRRWETRA